MEIIEVKCKNCGKNVYVQDKYVRKDIFCTLGCMGDFEKEMTRR